VTKDQLESEILKAMLSEAASDRREGFNGLARAVADRLHELGLPLDGLTVPRARERHAVPLDRRIALAEEKRREAWAAINMVRRAVEELGVGLVQFDETVGPEAHHEAEAIIAGIHKLHDRLTAPAR
jgi:hypothetical protein